MIDVFFDYASKHAGLGAWACVVDFPHGPEVFGGLLQGNVSERRAMSETLNVLIGLEVRYATLYTDCRELSRAAQRTLPPGYELYWVSRDTPMHRRAHDQAVVLRDRYESLRTVVRASQLAPLTDLSGTPHAARHAPLHSAALRAAPPELRPVPAPCPAGRRAQLLTGQLTLRSGRDRAARGDLCAPPDPDDLILLRRGTQLVFLTTGPGRQIQRRALTLDGNWKQRSADLLGDLGLARHGDALRHAIRSFVRSGARRVRFQGILGNCRNLVIPMQKI